MTDTSEPDAGWGDFTRTVLEFDRDRLRIDLCESPGDDVKAALRGMGLERSFGILTANDPMGVTQTPEENGRLEEALRGVLDARGTRHVSVNACSPDRSHCERSEAVAMTECDTVAVANHFAQLAIYWFDGESFWIVPVRSSRPRLRLPVRD